MSDQTNSDVGKSVTPPPVGRPTSKITKLGLSDGFGQIFGFVAYAALRFRQDDCQQRAAALTFTSLLAMVPLLAVSFAIFAAFPAYESLKGEVQGYLFRNFIPSVGDEVLGYLEQFTAQTGRLTAVGIVFLALSAVMLLLTISTAMNKIWQSKQTRGIVSRLLVFWAVLTLAPMLFGASISMSSYLFAIARTSSVESVTGDLTRFAAVIPFLLQAMGLTVLYLVMPNYPVRRRDAFVGGLVAGVMLDLLKRGFGFYVTSFPTYETIYGAMATVPIFLIWVYLSWMVVLFGAEVAAGMPEWRHGARTPRREGLPPLQRLAAGLAILNALQRAASDGQTLSERRLARAAHLGPNALGWATRHLAKLNYITKTDRSNWVLSRDLSLATLSDLYADLGLDLTGSMPKGQRNTAWGQRFNEILEQATAARSDVMAIDLRTLLAATASDAEAVPDDEDDEEQKSKGSFNAKILALIGLGTLAQGS